MATTQLTSRNIHFYERGWTDKYDVKGPILKRVERRRACSPELRRGRVREPSQGSRESQEGAQASLLAGAPSREGPGTLPGVPGEPGGRGARRRVTALRR